MPYHKGRGVKKSGPKGNWKAKGVVSDMIIKLIEDEPYLSGESIAKRIKKETGVKLTARRIQQIRHDIGGKR
jgi:hypothetical protein